MQFLNNNNYYFTVWDFFTPAQTDFFLLKSEWQQISSDVQDSSKHPNFFSAVVWMVSALPLIDSSTSLFSKLLETVPKALNMISIIVTFKFHNFFLLSGNVSVFFNYSFIYLFIYSFIFVSFIFTVWSAGTAKSTKWQVFFYFLFFIFD